MLQIGLEIAATDDPLLGCELDEDHRPLIEQADLGHDRPAKRYQDRPDGHGPESEFLEIHRVSHEPPSPPPGCASDIRRPLYSRRDGCCCKLTNRYTFRKTGGEMPRSSAPTRQAILDAAYGLFRRKGFVRVSMDEIAASAAVTKRTLYYHFTSKDLLLAASARSAACSGSSGLPHVWRRSRRLRREHHRPTFQGSRRLVGPAAMGRFGIYPPCHRACRSPWTPRSPDRAPSQGNARRSSGGPFGKRPCGVTTQTRPRNLAAFRGRNRSHSYPWRPQLRCGSRGSGQETDPL